MFSHPANLDELPQTDRIARPVPTIHLSVWEHRVRLETVEDRPEGGQ